MMKNSTMPLIVKEIMGKQCCRQRVGEWRSLSIGFGEKQYHTKKGVDQFYGEWEIGTYSAAWRVSVANKVVCSSQDSVTSTLELDERLQLISLGSVSGIEVFHELDVRVFLDNGVTIDFMQLSIDVQDEVLHIFGPGHLYVEYSNVTGWKEGKSNEPWKSTQN